MLTSVKAAIEADTPIWAECGGMMVLFDEIQTVDGNSHAVWGVIKGKIRMQKKLGGLGPQFMETRDGQLRGHTFHYSVCDSQIPASRTTIKHSQISGLSAGEVIYEVGSVQASYFHAWFASNPRASAGLFLKSER